MLKLKVKQLFIAFIDKFLCSAIQSADKQKISNCELINKKTMTDDIKKYFKNLLHKIKGLYVIQVTDRDGVPLLRVSQDNIDFALMPSFIPTFTTACDQASKLGLGKNKTIISMYSNYQVVQMNKLPLILTFVGAEDCNTGHIMAIEQQIDAHLEDIKLAVTDT